MTFLRACRWATAIALVNANIAAAQLPPPVYVPAPPPVYAPPPPPMYPPPPPRIYVAPPPPPVYYVRPRPYRRYGAGHALRVFGALLLAFGIFAVIGGGTVLIVGEANKGTMNECPGCFPVGYGLLGGGAWGILSGITLMIIGRVIGYQAYYGLNNSPVLPTFSLVPSGVGGGLTGTAGIGFNF
jgi:hypothetical protein